MLSDTHQTLLMLNVKYHLLLVKRKVSSVTGKRKVLSVIELLRQNNVILIHIKYIHINTYVIFINIYYKFILNYYLGCSINNFIDLFLAN